MSSGRTTSGVDAAARCRSAAESTTRRARSAGLVSPVEPLVVGSLKRVPTLGFCRATERPMLNERTLQSYRCGTRPRSGRRSPCECSEVQKCDRTGGIRLLRPGRDRSCCPENAILLQPGPDLGQFHDGPTFSGGEAECGARTHELALVDPPDRLGLAMSLLPALNAEELWQNDKGLDESFDNVKPIRRSQQRDTWWPGSDNEQLVVTPAEMIVIDDPLGSSNLAHTEAPRRLNLTKYSVRNQPPDRVLGHF